MRLYTFLEDEDENPVLESFPAEEEEGAYRAVFWITGEEMVITPNQLGEGVFKTPQDAWEFYRQTKEDEIEGNNGQIEELNNENIKLTERVEKARQIAEKEHSLKNPHFNGYNGHAQLNEA